MRSTTHRALLGGALLAFAGCVQHGVPSGSAAAGAPPPASAAKVADADAVRAPVVDAPVVGVPSAKPALSGGARGSARVYIDPATGEAREPTRAERAAEGAAGRVRAAGGVGQAGSEGVQREHFVLPDGTEGVKLLPRDRHAVVVCRHADGSYDSRCPRASAATTP